MEVFYGRDILLLAPLLMLCALQALWLFVPAGKMEKAISPKVLNAVFCLCLAITVGTLLRQYPWTTLPTQTDSSVFLYIGKQMHAGKVPYVDLFDHKGPILYFIQWLRQVQIKPADIDHHGFKVIIDRINGTLHC